ncbi:MAG: hypothetical protein J2P36_39905 [Ktedonobacteraceae bacterium]|nr:hypothetical protein [Ktedonobacteraceae bacterium]
MDMKTHNDVGTPATEPNSVIRLDAPAGLTPEAREDNGKPSFDAGTLHQHASEGWQTALGVDAKKGESETPDPHKHYDYDDGAKRLVESLPGDPSLALPGDSKDSMRQLGDPPTTDLGNDTRRLVEELPGSQPAQNDAYMKFFGKKFEPSDEDDSDYQEELPPHSTGRDTPQTDEYGRYTQNFGFGVDGPDPKGRNN